MRIGGQIKSEVPIDFLYDDWVGTPDPSQWPEYVRDNPVLGHGRYCFQQGVMPGLLLFAECAGSALDKDE